MSRAVIVVETMRSVMYLPFYLAAVRGDWQRFGLKVQIIASPTPADAPQMVLNGNADVYFGGPMRVLMHHDSEPDSPLTCFAQIVAGDPFSLVGLKPNPSFDLKDLPQYRLAVASEAPTPWLTLQDDLRRIGIDPADLNRMPNLSMAENLEKLKFGEVDVIQVFAPFTDQALSAGYGHIWHEFATRGPIGFSTFVTTRDFLSTNRDTCRGLVAGIAEAQNSLFTQSPSSVAAQVIEFFPDLQIDTLIRIIGRYTSSGVWARTPHFPALDFNRLKAAMLSGGHITTDTPYRRVVDNKLI